MYIIIQYTYIYIYEIPPLSRRLQHLQLSFQHRFSTVRGYWSLPKLGESNNTGFWDVWNSSVFKSSGSFVDKNIWDSIDSWTVRQLLPVQFLIDQYIKCTVELVMMYLLRLWAGVSQCKITQYLYVQKTNLPGVFSWFQRGVFNPDPQRPVKNWFWQRTFLQAVFSAKLSVEHIEQPDVQHLSTWSSLSLQIFN